MLYKGSGAVGGSGGCHGNRFKPPRRPVNDGQQEGVVIGDRERPHQVEAYGGEPPSGNWEVVEGGLGVPGDLGSLTGDTLPATQLDVLDGSWPHVPRRDQLL